MSKKLASGADAIVLDVKVGDGAFMKHPDDARQLAEAMVSIAKRAGRRAVAVLTRMDEPLGFAVGNALEVREAILTLRNQGPADLTELCLTLGAEMVVQGGKARTVDEARDLLRRLLENGEAIQKFKDFVAAQGGDARVADDLSLLPKASVIKSFLAPADGVVEVLRAQAIGLVAMRLGAGRAKQSDVIDPAVGLVLRRKLGQTVVQGEPLIEVHANSEEAADAAIEQLRACVEIGGRDPFDAPLVLDVVRDASPAHTVNVSEQALANLMEAAREARACAYVPYSRFAVGAALQLEDGRIITGANIENASYGLTNCAERTAVFRALMENGGKPLKVRAIAVIADSDGPVAPCGACRQVLAEFCAPETPVWLGDLAGGVKPTTVEGLLPYAFGPGQMHADSASDAASPAGA
jgi:homotetrameric cytidine deaminase